MVRCPKCLSVNYAAASPYTEPGDVGLCLTCEAPIVYKSRTRIRLAKAGETELPLVPARARA
jgi:hypothetical protein